MRDGSRLPPGVSTSRVVAFVQGGLGALTGLLLMFGGSAVATASGLSGSSAGLVVILIGVVITAVSGLLIWGGVGLGRLSPRARVGVLLYEWLSLLLGMLGLTHPGLGLVGLLLAGVAVYYLQFDARTKAAFGIGTGPTPTRATRTYRDALPSGEPVTHRPASTTTATPPPPGPPPAD